MANPKPLASLSSGLLARPGQAKPAMRPQLFGYAPGEDLGWNDMGQQPQANQAPVPSPAPQPRVAALEPAPSARHALTPAPSPSPAPPPAPIPVPPVLTERAKLAKAVAPKAKAPAKATPLPRAAASGRKAAFTLRLDADRHLRLRLASAVGGRSAQQLVVEALDTFLDAQPQVEALARQLPAGLSKSFSGEKKS